MARLFNNAASERIQITGATNLAGFSWTYGTISVIIKFANTSGSQGIVGLLFSGGTALQWYYDTNTLTYWNSGTGSDFTFSSPGTTNYYQLWLSKDTGTVAPFFAVHNMSAGTWSSGNGSANQANHGTLTDVVIGADDTSASSKFRGEMWSIAFWRNQPMGLSQMKTMGDGYYLKSNPTAYTAWPAARDHNAQAMMFGQCQMRPSAQVGATRGTSKDPPGWNHQAYAKRR